MTNEKNVKYYDNLAVASSPHLVTALDTQKTMMWVLIALIPSFIASVPAFSILAQAQLSSQLSAQHAACSLSGDMRDFWAKK